MCFFSQIFYGYYRMKNFNKFTKKLGLFPLEIKEDLPWLPELWIYSTLKNKVYGRKTLHNLNEVKFQMISWINQP